MTPEEINKKIAELEKWLEVSSPEDEARPMIESDLRKLKEKRIAMEMSKASIDDREDFLHMILQFKTEFPNALTDGEQICINQERGMLRRQLAFLNGEIEESEIPVYELPESITKKIKATISLIEKKVGHQNQIIMSRVKLFELSENVQAIAVKDQSPNDKPCIKVTIYTDAHGAFMDLSFTSEHETEELRDKNFDEDHTAQLIRIFNKVNIQSGLKLEPIPEKPIEEIEVKEPKESE